MIEEVKGNPQTWWYENYVCWTCRVQNGVKNDPLFLGTKKQICSNNLTNEYFKTIRTFKKEEKEKKDNGRICYRCHNQMVDVGFKFKTPKKYDVKQWKHLEQTWENQYKFINGVKTYVGPKKCKVQQSF